MKRLENKVALITGASRGIGRAIAQRFAKEGAHVIINFLSKEDEAQNTLLSLENFGKKARILQFDASDEEAVEDAVDIIKKEYGAIDILVNNAGISRDGLLLRLKSEDFDHQIAVNLKSAFICSKACAKIMIKSKSGRIITISSVVGEIGNAGQSVYAASKAGLIAMTKSLAKELASRNILVNAITPGYIETDMTKDLLEKGEESVVATIPLKRIGKPEDIAAAAAFLASSDANYITGQVLPVNGGISM